MAKETVATAIFYIRMYLVSMTALRKMENCNCIPNQMLSRRLNLTVKNVEHSFTTKHAGKNLGSGINK